MWTKLFAETLIPSFVVMVIIAVIVALLLRNKEEKYKMIPIQIIAVILVALELMKQIYGIVTGYVTYWLPFHFCSLFIFVLPIMAFYRGKHKDLVRIVGTAACTMLFLFMCVYPTLIYSEENILNIGKDLLSFHTVIFHNLVLLAFVLMVAIRPYKFKAKRDLLAVLVFFACFCVISGSMANILKTNYNSFYYCQVLPIESIRVSLNNAMGGFGQFVYVLMISCGTIAVGIASYGLLRLINLIVCKCTAKKTKQQ